MTEVRHHTMLRLQSVGARFFAALLLDVAYVLLEVGAGLLTGSLSLLSDAGHNLADSLTLLLALMAFLLSRVPGNKRFTYGYKRSTILIALVNSLVLCGACVAVLLSGLHRMAHPMPIDAEAVSLTALVGMAVKALTAWLLLDRRGSDLNMRAAFLHSASDALLSLGIVVSSVIILLTGLTVVDAIASIAIAIVVLAYSVRLLVDSIRLSLDGVPRDVSLDCLQESLLALPHVVSIHHIHVWALSTTVNAMTAHVIIDSPENAMSVKKDIRHILGTHGIVHSTIETEAVQSACPDRHRSECVC